MLKLISLIIILITSGLFLMYVYQRNFMYYPITQKSDKNLLENITVVTLKTDDNLELKSWYHKGENNNPTVIYIHGNGGNIGLRAKQAQYFIDHGMGILLLEYRGYGGNPGKPTEEGLYNDARAALKFLHNKKIKNDKIVLYGESLGTGIATKLATELTPCAVILQSPYTSMENLARTHYPYLPIFIKDKYDSLERIDKVHAPILILHGTKDTVVPFSMGQSLFYKSNEPKKFVSLEDKAHNNLWDDEFANVVITFIKEYCTKHQQ